MIGQNLNYARQTAKKACIVLALKDRGDEKHSERLTKIARQYRSGRLMKAQARCWWKCMKLLISKP